MTHASLFSGIGGFDLAAEWMGWENVFHCEINPFGQKVLKYYWPNSISYENIITTDFSIHRGTIDVLTGGFPCQPYSVAGLRKGKEDERHLWPHMLRAIREVKPRWVVGENVLGLVGWNGGLVFEEVQADLEAQGYEVQPYILPAASVNAPHRRDRVWFVAYASGSSKGSSGENREVESNWRENNDEQGSRGIEGELSNGCSELLLSPANSKNNRQQSESRGGGARNKRRILPGGRFSEGGEPVRSCQNAAHTNRDKRCERRVYPPEPKEAERHACSCNACSDKGRTWDYFPTESPICSRNDGVSARLDGITFPKFRSESIKAAGNAIVPQVVLQIFKAIEAYAKL